MERKKEKIYDKKELYISNKNEWQERWMKYKEKWKKKKNGKFYHLKQKNPLKLMMLVGKSIKEIKEKNNKNLEIFVISVSFCLNHYRPSLHKYLRQKFPGMQNHKILFCRNSVRKTNKHI